MGKQHKKKKTEMQNLLDNASHICADMQNSVMQHLPAQAELV